MRVLFGNLRGRRLVLLAMSLALVAAACNGSDEPASTTTSATTSSPTTEPPVTPVTGDVPDATTTPPSTTAAPAPTTTTDPPSLEPSELTLLLEDDTVATYEGTLETVLAWEGAGAAALLGEAAERGSISAEMEGRRRILTIEQSATIPGLEDPGVGFFGEVIEDFTPASGQLTTSRDGAEESTTPSRVELVGLVPAFGSFLATEGILRPEWIFQTTGAPEWLNWPDHPYVTTAVLGPTPPFSAEPVDVGSTWENVSPLGSLFGSLSLDASVLSEVAIQEGELGFLIQFSGSLGDSVEVMPELALAMLRDTGPLPADAGLLQARGGTATVREAEIEGSTVTNPATGSIESIRSSLSFVVDFQPEAEGAASFTIETRISRDFTLVSRSAATIFDRESILERFSRSPDEVAARSLDAVEGLDPLDSTDADFVVERLELIRPDLVAGVAAGRLSTGDDSALVVAVAAGGEFRGAPFLAEELAAVISVSRPSGVTLSGKRAYRVTIDGDEWLFWGNQDRLFVAVGDRGPATAAMRALAGAPEPYLWQAGDCLDFSDPFLSDAPYAPFGLHGLRHCGAPHVYEIIHSEVLPEPAGARFPSDLSLRSEEACAEAFYEFTFGRSEIETSFSLIRYLPDAEEWAQGWRYLACMVSLSGPEGPVQVTDPLDGANPEHVVELAVGTCLDGFRPVDCSLPHDREVIAGFQFDGGPGAPRPSLGALNQQIADDCGKAFESFEFADGPGALGLFEVTDLPTFWETGARDYWCTVVVIGDDGFPLQITGRLATGWEEAAGGVVA